MAVVIEVKGGVVQRVYSNHDYCIYLIDHDVDFTNAADNHFERIPSEPINDELAQQINKSDMRE